MRRLIGTLLLTAACALAQPEVRKIIDVKYADPMTVANAVRMFGVNANAEQSLHVVSIRGSAENVTAAEEGIQKLGVTPKTIELTVYLVNGVGGAKAGATDEVPAELASTVKQLHGLFAYKSYRLTESFILRVRENKSAGSGGVIPGTSSEYHFLAGRTTVSAGTPRLVHVGGMQFNVQTPNRRDKEGKMDYRPVLLNTDIEAAEGQ